MIHLHFAFEDLDEMTLIQDILQKISVIEYLSQEFTVFVHHYRFDFYMNLDNIDEVHIYEKK